MGKEHGYFSQIKDADDEDDDDDVYDNNHDDDNNNNNNYNNINNNDTNNDSACVHSRSNFYVFFQIYFIDLQLSSSETTQNNQSPLNIGFKVLRLSVAENSTINYYHYYLYYYTYYCYHYYYFCIKKRSEMYWFVRLYGVAVFFTVNRNAYCLSLYDSH